jgi:hypothetical protein
MTNPLLPFPAMNDAISAAVNAAVAARAATPAGAAPVHAATPVVNDAARSAANFANNPVAAMGNVAGNFGNPFGSMGINIPALGGNIGFPWGNVVPPPPGIEIMPAGPVAARTPYTQLAQNAMALLRNANKDLLSEALQIIRAKQLAGADIVNWLERRTKIGEVLGMPAANWSAETVSDFALAFQMNAARTPAMDAIAAVGILNMPELENEIRAENIGGTTTTDLVQNRRIVAQYPPPGTPLQPPYVVLVAVEYQDARRADDIVSSIVGNLVGWQSYKLPREAAAKLG